MTLLIGANFGSYGIIAADKKEVDFSDGEIISSHENASKIVETGIGLMTGSGYVSLLDNVKSGVASSSIVHTDDILSIITRERDLAKIELSSYALGQELLQTTSWLFSYITGDQGTPMLRIAMYQAPFSEIYFSTVERDKAIVVPPSDFTQSEAQSLEDGVNDHVKSLANLRDAQQNLSHNLSVVISTMDQVSQNSQMVSRSCDIGIIFDNGKMAVVLDVGVANPQFNLRFLDP